MFYVAHISGNETDAELALAKDKHIYAYSESDPDNFKNYLAEDRIARVRIFEKRYYMFFGDQQDYPSGASIEEVSFRNLSENAASSNLHRLTSLENIKVFDSISAVYDYLKKRNLDWDIIYPWSGEPIGKVLENEKLYCKLYDVQTEIDVCTDVHGENPYVDPIGMKEKKHIRGQLEKYHKRIKEQISREETK